MSRDLLNAATVAGTTAGAVAAESILSTMGVVFMGAFGGALYALLNQPPMTLGVGVRFFIARWLASQFCSWAAWAGLQSAFGSFNVPQTVGLLTVSFVAASMPELWAYTATIREALVRLWPRAKE